MLIGNRYCLLSLFIISLLIGSLLIACGGSGGGSNSTDTTSDSEVSTDDSTAEDEQSVEEVVVASDDATAANEETETDEECEANAAGNGDTVIAGPVGPDGADNDNPFRSLTVHPSDSNIILMGTERNGFVKSTDGGVTWTRYRQGLRHVAAGYPEIWDIAFDPSNPAVIYAATLDSPGPVTGDYPSSIAGVYKSEDAGETWSRANCGLVNSRITSIQVAGSDSSVVVIGVEGGDATFSDLAGQYFNGGIYRSTDAAENWSQVIIADNETVNGYWRLVSYGSGTSLMTFGFNLDDLTTNLGFIRSLDAGLTWTELNSELKNLHVAGFDLSSDGSRIYANERDSFETRVTTNSGVSWEATEINQANGPIALSPDNELLALYAGSTMLYRTADGFTTTEFILSTTETIADIVFAPSDASIIYVVTEGYLLYKSIDAGVSFNFLINIREDVLN